MINLDKYEVKSYVFFKVIDIWSPKSTNRPLFDLELKVKYALKPIVKKLLSIKIVIFNICTLGSTMGHRKLPQTNLSKDLLQISKLFFVHLWHLQF
jgi:hypothetical protein